MRLNLLLTLAIALFAFISLDIQAQEVDNSADEKYFLLSVDSRTSKRAARLYKYQNRGVLHFKDVLLAMRRGVMRPDSSPEWGGTRLPGQKYRNGINLIRPYAAKSGEIFCFAVDTDSLKSIYLNGYITAKTPNFRAKDFRREYIIVKLPHKINRSFFNDSGIATIQVYGYRKSRKKIYGTLVISKVSYARYKQFMRSEQKKAKNKGKEKGKNKSKNKK